MCMIPNKVHKGFENPGVTKKARHVYKVVRRYPPRENRYESMYNPIDRLRQDEYGTLGVSKTYEIGVKATSDFDSTPGLYCFPSIEAAYNYKGNMDVILEMYIPKGTRYVKGWTDPDTAVVGEYAQTVLCFEEGIPVREIYA